MENLVQHLDFLKKLASFKSPEKRKSFLQNISIEEIRVLIEICHNIVKGNVKLTSRQKHQLLPNAKFIRALAKKRTPLSARPILQKGHGIPFAPFLLPIVVEISRHLLTRRSL